MVFRSFLLIASFFIVSLKLPCQNLVVKYRCTSDGLVVRWAPTSWSYLKLLNEYSCVVQRVDIKTDKPITTDTIRPFSVDDYRWKSLIENDESAALVYKVLYDSQEGLDTLTAFGLYLVSCDHNVDVANAAGLYYSDTGLALNEKCKYTLRVVNGRGEVLSKDDLEFVYRFSGLPTVNDLHADFGDRIVSLSWTHDTLKKYFSYYSIERSEDSVNFERVNERPVVKLYTSDNPSEKEVFYKDSIPENYREYFYRVIGHSHFGEKSEQGNIVRGVPRLLFGMNPKLDSLWSNDNKVVNLQWSYPNGFVETGVLGVLPYRSDKSSSSYTTSLNAPLPIKTNEYVDSMPLFSGYYKVCLYTEYGDTFCSNERFIQLVDSVPPKSPDKLKGFIDSSGVAHLNWHANTEGDLIGYRLFRANATHEDPIELTRVLIVDTFVTDTLHLNTLSGSVYYSLVAVDHMYNNSEYSVPALLRRPDTVSPMPAFFTSVLQIKDSIKLKWTNSSSNDVLLTRLYIIEEGSDSLLVAWRPNAQFRSFSFASGFEKKVFKFRLVVEDSSGNVSSVVSRDVYVSAERAVKDLSFEAEVSLKEHTVSLKWKALDNAHSFMLYKSKGEGALRVYKTLNGDENSFVDRNLKVNNLYYYKLKARLKDGSEVMSEVQEVVY